MKAALKYYSIFILFIAFAPLTTKAQSQGIDCSNYLKNTLNTNEQFWVRVHAAEALILNNFSIDVEEVFSDALQGNGTEKIGALRLLARQNLQDSIRYDSIGRAVLQQFKIAQEEHTRLVALETLGKLGLCFPDDEITRLAQSGKGGIKTLAQWVLSNSGKAGDQSALTKLLFAPDTTQARYAAYALRFKENISPGAFSQLKKKLKETPESHPFRVYLLSSLWIHAPQEQSEDIKKELFSYLNGAVYERYEVYEALAASRAMQDVSLVKEGFLQDENDDVKVAAANAFLANEFHLQSRVGWPDWLVLFAYGAFMLGVGWYYSSLQKSKEDYFLGGRAVSPFISGISMYVSFFSAISYLAIAGEVIQYGPVIATVNILSAPIIFLLGSYFLIPFFMNLKITSAYEILERPFGNTVRKIASFIFVITRLVWMALLIYLAAKSMAIMMDWNDRVILIITVLLGIITIVYTVMGGLKAVLITDVIQFFILLFGAVVTIAMVAINFGGFHAIIPTSGVDHWTRLEFFNFNPYIRLTVFFALINNITWWICTTGADQMAIQRFVSTKDLKSARKSFLVTQVGQVALFAVLILVGFSVMQFYHSSPNLLPAGTDISQNADFLFPNFIANQFPTGMSGLVIAALFSASMSSLSSGINSVSSVLSTDIFHDLLHNKNKPDSLKEIRITTGFIGFLVILFSLAIPLIPGNIIEVTTKTNGLFIAPLFNLFFMALFIKRARPFGVVMGSVYGFLAAFTVAFWDVLTGNPSWSFLWIGISSLIVSVFFSLVFSILMPAMHGKKSLFWGMMLLLPWLLIYWIIL